MKTLRFIAIDEIEEDENEKFEFSLSVEDGMEASEVVEAMKEASLEFLKTEKGREVCENNGEVFDIGTFLLYVPNEICSKYGIEKQAPEEVLVVDNFLFSEEEIEEILEEQDKSER